MARIPLSAACAALLVLAAPALSQGPRERVGQAQPVQAQPAPKATGTSTSLSIIVNSAATPSTAIQCPAHYPPGSTSFTAPVAAGTTIATCVVSPANWSGALTIDPSSTHGAYFTLSGLNVNVASGGLTTPGTYSLILNANP